MKNNILTINKCETSFLKSFKNINDMDDNFHNFNFKKSLFLLIIVLFTFFILFQTTIAEELNNDETSNNETINDETNKLFFTLNETLINGINFISLNNQFYSFNKIPIIVCYNELNQSSVKNSFYCFDDNKIYSLNTKIWNETCVISVYDASKPYCSKIRFITNFNQNNISESQRLTEEIEIEQTIIFPDNILSQQRWDGGFNNPINTAIAIWLLSDFGDLYEPEIEKAIEWLNVNRNNLDKCWPSSSCSVYETSVVMAYLTLAGLDDSNRIYYDGRIWLENHQNYLSGEDWGIYISTNTDENNCTLNIGNSKQEINDFNRTDNQFIKFSPEYNLRINLSCDYRVYFSIMDERNLSIFSSSNSRDVSYTFPRGACWSVNQWQYCNDVISVYSTIVNLSEERKKSAKEYLEIALQKDHFVGKYINSFDRILHSALYYHYINQDSSIAEYLVFRQNNDGSFGEGSIEEKVSRTLNVVQALRKENLPFTKESIADSLRWLFLNNPLNGFNNILSDSLVYFTLKTDDINVLFYDEELLVVDKDKKIILNNPFDKNYNLTYAIKGKLKEAISIEMDNEIDAFSDLEINIIKKDLKSGIYQGFLYIVNTKDIDSNFTEHDLDYFEKIFVLPIMVKEEPFLYYDYENEISVIGSSGKFKLTNIETNSNFNCVSKFDSLDDINFEINKKDSILNIDINFDTSERNSFILNGQFICESISIKKIFEKNFSIKIEQFPYNVIEILEEELTINRRNDQKEITIKNLIDETIEAKIELGNLASAYLVLEKNNVLIEPLSEVKINILNNFERRSDVVFSDEIKIFAIGHEIIIPIESNIIYVPFFQSNLFKTILYIFIILILLSIFKIIHYYSDDLKKYFKNIYSKQKNKVLNLINKIKNKLPDKLKEKLNIKDEEKEEIIEETPIHHSGVESLIKIMIDLNHDEKDIIKRLKKEGLSDDEINESLKNVNEELEVKKEIDREESVIKVIKKMDEDSDTIRSFLKQSGFSDEQINQAFEEIEEELAHKEEELQKHLAQFKDPEEEVEETSLLDVEKSKAKEDD